jgi:hypothetical protein
MLKCRDVEQMIGNDSIRNAGFAERFAVRLHLMMCRHCRAYARQIRAIGDAARGLLNRPEDAATLARLQDRIRNR